MSGLIRHLDLAATVLMATAAILTAWAAFQSSRWSSVESTDYSKANAARIESARLDGRADALRAIDISVFLTWLQAVGEELRAGTTTVDPVTGYRPEAGGRSLFYFERMRDEFRPALEAWIAADPLGNPDAPSTPFAMEQYRLADAVAAADQLQRAEDFIAEAQRASANSDNHVLTAVALALSIFFAGVSSKLERVRKRVSLVVLSTLVLLGAVAFLLALPTQIRF